MAPFLSEALHGAANGQPRSLKDSTERKVNRVPTATDGGITDRTANVTERVVVSIDDDAVRDRPNMKGSERMTVIVVVGNAASQPDAKPIHGQGFGKV